MSTEQQPEVGATPKAKELTIGEVFTTDNLKTALKAGALVVLGYFLGRRKKR